MYLIIFISVVLRWAQEGHAINVATERSVQMWHWGNKNMVMKTKYRLNLHKDFETKKGVEHFLNEMKKVTSSFWSDIETITWNEITEKDVKHLVKCGDSLFGMQSIACGIKLTTGMVGYIEPEKVTCGACKKTNLYKQLTKDGLK